MDTTVVAQQGRPLAPAIVALRHSTPPPQEIRWARHQRCALFKTCQLPEHLGCSLMGAALCMHP
eukprot:2110325-Prymnesium_polylepis.1